MSALRVAQRGQAAVDYLLVAALVALAIGLGSDGGIGRLVAAVAEHHRRFTFAISLP
ncbi:MAG: hypothetical protein RJA99_600 [Pseudomonadota bacterium]|jgi:hypothetical protein